jgi:hypothetical protein
MRCVPAHDFTVAKVFLWRKALNDDPPYQRESAVWSLDKQQLFIDSLLNGYDAPKIYLHDLRGRHPTKVYAVVDGKQRLTTIWRFLEDAFPLSPEFRVEEANLPEIPPGTTPPSAGMRFSELDPVWQEVLKTTFLSVVLIQNATEEDIEELFSRLNNGEPLNAAEKRNAKGGDMAQLVREVARRPFFTERLRFTNARYHHFDVAARLLLIEQAHRDPAALVPDLKSRTLDGFVEANRRLGAAERADLLKRLDHQLALLERVFTRADPLLSTQAWPPLYYLFTKSVAKRSTDERLPEILRDFLEWFHARRRAELKQPEERRDPALVEFSHLMQHGTNDRRSLERCVQILTRCFLERHPEIAQRVTAARA